MAAFFTDGLEASAAKRSSGGEQKAARIRCFALNQRHREFESSALRHAVSGLEHSPGMSAKSPRVGVMCPPHRHRRELRSRVMPRHVDFLSVGEEFGADACNLARATQGGNLRISSRGRTSKSREN